MRKTIFLLSCVFACARVATATPLYSNLAVNTAMGAASRPDSGGVLEIEAADDFILNSAALVTEFQFIGLLTGGATSANVSGINLEIYRVFPLDSDTVRLPNVPTRANSPSDVAFAERDGTQLSLTATVIAPNFTAANSVKNGINPSPGQQTNGEGPVTGTELLFDAVLNGALFLPQGHYFFVPQVAVNNGGSFYWLAASRAPIVGTPINPDLQAWIRNGNLDPDWLRIGTDIIGGGASAPTFNLAFEVDGSTVPEPVSLLLVGTGVAFAAGRRRRTKV